MMAILFDFEVDCLLLNGNGGTKIVAADGLLETFVVYFIHLTFIVYAMAFGHTTAQQHSHL